MTVVAEAQTLCHNCGRRLPGRYCSECGQKAAPLNPTLHDLVHELTHEMLHVDGRIFRSVRTLLTAPGVLTREQFLGRKARWLSPTRLYLIFSVIYFAVAALDATPGPARVTVTGSDQETAEELRRLGFATEEELQKAVSEAQRKWAPRVMFVLVPLFAWFVQLACRGSGRNYPQHLYFALHVHAAVFAAGVLSTAARLTGITALATTVQVLVFVYAAWYLLVALRTAYGLSIGGAAVRGALVAVVYFLAVVAAVAAIVVPVLLRRG